VASSTKTDAAGYYTLDQLMAGKYYIVTQKDIDSPRFFFPGAVYVEDAQPVQIEFGQEYSDANIRLRTVSLKHMVGRVAGIDMLPGMKALSVHLYSEGTTIFGTPARESLLGSHRRPERMSKRSSTSANHRQFNFLIFQMELQAN
jgi:hypothetical protein